MDDAAGEHVPVVWRGRQITAFVPTPLAERRLDLEPRAVARTAAAVAELTLAASVLPVDVEPLARLLLHAEGVASSFLEGVRAPVADVVLAEAAALGAFTPAAWVAANLAAVTDATAGQRGQRLAQRPGADRPGAAMTIGSRRIRSNTTADQPTRAPALGRDDTAGQPGAAQPIVALLDDRLCG